MSNIAIILSGGVGSRMGLNIPKQYVLVDDKPVILYCLKTFVENKSIDRIVICCADEWVDFIKCHLKKIQTDKTFIFSPPGETRQYTIYNALKTLDGQIDDDDTVIIHDAARPLLSHDLIDNCLAASKFSDGVLPVLKMKDTVYYSNDGKTIHSLLDRKLLYAGQAPEAFNYKKYYDAHKTISDNELRKINGSTEIAYKCGLNIVLIGGEEINFKITTSEDLETFKTIIANNR